MANQVRGVPDGYHTLTPHLTVRNAAAAIEFYKRAFGAEELMRSPGPGGKIMHAALRVGDSTLFLADEFPEMGECGMQAPGPEASRSSMLHVYVEDVDRVFDRAVAEGARVTMPLMDTFWGDRYGQIVDPFGHAWALATRIENLTPEEMQRRGEAAMAEMAGAHA